MSSKIEAGHVSRSRKRHWLAAFAVLLAAGGAGPCLAQAGPATAAARLDPERLALANQIIDLSYPAEGRRAMLMRASDTMTAQMRAAVARAAGHFDAGVERIFQRFVDRMRVHTERATAAHSDSIFAAFARAYARQFTRDELVEIRAFVSTPTGRKYVEKAVDLLADPDVARANTAYMTSVISAMEPMMAELRREVEAYLRTRDERANESPPRGTG